MDEKLSRIFLLTALKTLNIIVVNLSEKIKLQLRGDEWQNMFFILHY